jgi:hypothetical protein
MISKCLVCQAAQKAGIHTQIHTPSGLTPRSMFVWS